MKINILCTIILTSSFAQLNGEETFDINAQKIDSKAYVKIAETLKFDVKEAFDIIKKESKQNKDFDVYNLSSTPWFIEGKYFFPYKASLLFSRKNRFRELGVYVDGSSGSLEKVIRKDRYIRVSSE